MQRSRIFGIRFDNSDCNGVVHRITGRLAPGTGPKTVVTANLDHVVEMRRNPAFRRCYDRAWVATADGMPIYIYARLRGARIPERVTGADLFEKLMDALDSQQHRCFFIAAKAETARRVRHRLLERGFSANSIAFDVPPFGFETDRDASSALARRIREHATTHLFVGVGSPKSEVWIDENRSELGDCYALSVGAALDFFAGLQKRAPVWIQNSGFEWFWRFAHEPRRLFRRYFISSWPFIAVVIEDLAAERPLRR